MAFVYSLRYFLQMGTTWLLPLVILYVVMLVANSALGFCTPQVEITDPRPALEAVRKSHGLPGLGAAIVTDSGVQILATTGIRKKGDSTAITDQDHWHLGSCGKAMTATMIARLVEAGTLRFEQTLGETFPEHAGKMNDQLRSVTLINLLSHCSGLPANFNVRAYEDEPNPTVARGKALVEAMRQPLLSKPGTEFLYSNWGYTLAGHMAEKATGKSWETLMRTEVFEPLGMTTAGFGGTGSPGKIDQPWPHSAWGRPMPSNGAKMDNLPVLGPAGAIHMSLTDWGTFVAEHLKGARGTSNYLSQATFQKLHTGIKEDYALGWASLERPGGSGYVLHHGGDNTMNCATVWVMPHQGCAALVVTNQGSADKPLDQVALELLKAWSKYLKQSPFSGVRWEEHVPKVRIGESWFTLESIDDVSAGDIVAYCRRMYGTKWRKRFAEDLVEVLIGMGHRPKDNVRLVVRPSGSSMTQTLENVALKEANRQAAKERATTP